MALKRLTSELVGRFVHAAVDATRAAHGDRPLLRYTADLVVPAGAAAEVALLKAVALRYVMSDPGRLAMQARQRELLVELATALRDGAPDSLDPVFAGTGPRPPTTPPGCGWCSTRSRSSPTTRRSPATVLYCLRFAPAGSRALHDARRRPHDPHGAPPSRH